MRVLVTGGTGFVGSHTVARLAAAGHQVRMLVRDAGGVRRSLEPHEISVADVHVGDVTDEDSVRTAVAGCDAVIHAASVFSYDPRDADEIAAINVRGTENVLSAAVAAGCSPIVHVSSVVAFLPPANRLVTEESPVGTASTAYFRSKAQSERIARDHQDRGHPVMITYPGAVTGPRDPYLQELNRAIVMSLTYPVVPGVRGAVLPVVDVRDVAEAHARVLAAGAGSARYLLVGHHTGWTEFVSVLSQLIGRRLRIASSPAGVALAGARLIDVLQRRIARRLPISYEMVNATVSGARFDSHRASELLGVDHRPLEESLRDTVQWLVDAGHVDARKAGRLASPLAA